MLAFAHIEKCGGSTLLDLLRRNFVLDHCDVIPRDKNSMLLSPSDLKTLLRLRPSLKSLAGHSIRLHCGLDPHVAGLRYVTCLRDPVRRCISEYQFFFVALMPKPVEFERWLAREERQNFQTRAIAGEPNVERAKQLLDESFSVVGVLEQFDDFLSALAWLAHDDLNMTLDRRYEVQNAITQRRRPSKVPDPPSDFRDQIVEANALDIELYQHALTVTLPRQRDRLRALGWEAHPVSQHTNVIERLSAARKLAFYRLYRNLVYKPAMGYWPAKHALPIYRNERKAA